MDDVLGIPDAAALVRHYVYALGGRSSCLALMHTCKAELKVGLLVPSRECKKNAEIKKLEDQCSAAGTKVRTGHALWRHRYYCKICSPAVEAARDDCLNLYEHYSGGAQPGLAHLTVAIKAKATKFLDFFDEAVAGFMKTREVMRATVKSGDMKLFSVALASQQRASWEDLVNYELSNIVGKRGTDEMIHALIPLATNRANTLSIMLTAACDAKRASTVADLLRMGALATEQHCATAVSNCDVAMLRVLGQPRVNPSMIDVAQMFGPRKNVADTMATIAYLEAHGIALDWSNPKILSEALGSNCGRDVVEHLVSVRGVPVSAKALGRCAYRKKYYTERLDLLEWLRSRCINFESDAKAQDEYWSARSSILDHIFTKHHRPTWQDLRDWWIATVESYRRGENLKRFISEDVVIAQVVEVLDAGGDPLAPLIALYGNDVPAGMHAWDLMKTYYEGKNAML